MRGFDPRTSPAFVRLVSFGGVFADLAMPPTRFGHFTFTPRRRTLTSPLFLSPPPTRKRSRAQTGLSFNGSKRRPSSWIPLSFILPTFLRRRPSHKAFLLLLYRIPGSTSLEDAFSHRLGAQRRTSPHAFQEKNRTYLTSFCNLLF